MFNCGHMLMFDCKNIVCMEFLKFLSGLVLYSKYSSLIPVTYVVAGLLLNTTVYLVVDSVV